MTRNRAVDPQWLRRAALYHLARYETSAVRMAALLRNKAARRCDDPPPELEPWIAALIADLVEERLIDDRRYGGMQARVAEARGLGARRSLQALVQRGIDKGLALSILAEGEDALVLALRFAAKKRLGPYRDNRGLAAWATDRQRQRQREIAAMARAGHSLAIAARIVDSLDALQLEAECEGGEVF